MTGSLIPQEWIYKAEQAHRDASGGFKRPNPCINKFGRGPEGRKCKDCALLRRAAEVIGSCGIEVESLLLIVIHKNDSGVNVCNAFQNGSVFSSIGAAQSWIIDNTRISN